MTFTLACVMVRGKRRRYTAKYVHRLREMVARHTDRPFRTVCLTDQPDEMPEGVEAVVIPNPAPARGWWAKLHLFHPAMPFDDRVLYLDLDVLVLGDLEPILDFPADFAICADSAPDFRGKNGQKAIKRYNSSCMVWDHKAREQFFRRFDKRWMDELWSDQDALALMSPEEKTFPAEWFTRVGPDSHPFAPQVKLGLCIKYKNHKAMKLFPWFREYWI
jgi:alpha-N-acetylglucosamine transferase